MSGELTEFEQKSALVPKQMPYAILGGFGLALVIFILIGIFGKNEAVDDLKKAEQDQPAETAPAAASAASSEDVDI